MRLRRACLAHGPSENTVIHQVEVPSAEWTVCGGDGWGSSSVRGVLIGGEHMRVAIFSAKRWVFQGMQCAAPPYYPFLPRIKSTRIKSMSLLALLALCAVEIRAWKPPRSGHPIPRHPTLLPQPSHPLKQG